MKKRRFIDESKRMQQSPRPMRILRYFLAGLCLATIAASAQTNNSNTNSLTLEECIQTALKHNFDIQIKRYGPQIARYNLNSSYAGYDPTLSFSGEHDFSLSPAGIDAQGRPFGGTSSENDRLNTDLGGLLPWGLTYDLGGNLSDRTTLSGTNFDETTSGNVGVVRLSQPLLKNFWIDSTRYNIAIKKRDLKISDLDLRAQVMNTVGLVEEAYYNLIFSEENVKVQIAARDLAKRLLEENKTKVRIGALAPLDEKQAESQVASSEADLLAALGTRDTQQRVLKNLLSDDYSKWEDVVVKPTEPLLAVPQSFNKQESWQKGLSMRPDLQQSKLSLEKQGYDVRLRRNQLFPELDLFGSYGFNAGATREYSGALGQLRRGTSPSYSAGAGVTIPLGSTGARNLYKVAKATKEQMALELKQLEQTVLVQIENAIAVATTSFERVRATKNASEFAEAALDAEQKKLQNGKSTSFQVLSLQKDLTARRTDEIRALADYNIALSRLAFNEGTTLERRKISLEIK